MKRQFSLLRLFALISLVAAVAAVVGSHIRHANLISHSVSRIQAAGGTAKVVRSNSWIPWLAYDQITVLDLAGPDEPVDLSILHDLSAMETVREIRLDGRIIDRQTLQALSEFKTLEKLSLCGTFAGEDGLEHLAALQHLIFLDLAQCDVTNRSLDVIRQLSHLESLSVASNAVTVEELSKLRNPRLSIIDASDCEGERLDLSNRGFGGITALTTLSVCGCDVDSLETHPPNPTSGLRALNLRGTSTSLAGLAQACPKLSELAIEPWAMNEVTLPELHNLPYLEKLIVFENPGRLVLVWDEEKRLQPLNVNGARIRVPGDQLKLAEKTLGQLMKSNARLRLMNYGKLTGHLYDRRRVVGPIAY